MEIILLSVATVIFSILYLLNSEPERNAKIPWFGLPRGKFAFLRAYCREYNTGTQSLVAGYKQFSLRKIPFYLASAGFSKHIILPPEYTRWVAEQPEEILSHDRVLFEYFGVNYLLPPGYPDLKPIISEAIRATLTRKLARMHEGLLNDVRRTTDATLGMDMNDWTEIDLEDALTSIMFQAQGRVIIGDALVQDERFMRYLRQSSAWFGAGTIVVGQLMPRILRPLLGFLFSIPLWYYGKQCGRYTNPRFKQRYREMICQPDKEQPEDMITGLLRTTLSKARDPDRLLKEYTWSFIILAGTAMRTSSVGFTNVFLDLLSSDLDKGYYQTLREEAQSVLKSDKEWSNSKTVSELHHLDSTIRESLRLNPVFDRGMMAEVVPKAGITLPEGPHLPKGTWIGIPVTGIHADERFYPEPQSYRPFRFLPSTETGNKRSALSSGTDTYLSWGHSRHSCPGRWLASHSIKLTMAYILTHYDIQPLSQRPPSKIVGSVLAPPLGFTIRVKRRKI